MRECTHDIFSLAPVGVASLMSHLHLCARNGASERSFTYQHKHYNFELGDEFQFQVTLYVSARRWRVPRAHSAFSPPISISSDPFFFRSFLIVVSSLNLGARVCGMCVVCVGGGVGADFSAGEPVGPPRWRRQRYYIPIARRVARIWAIKKHKE